MNDQRIKFIVKAVVGFIVMYLVVSLVVMLLWNWLIPGIFNLRRINYAESAGLLLLSKILLSSFRKDHLQKINSDNSCQAEFVNSKEESPLTSEQKSALKEHFKRNWCTPKVREEDNKLT